MSMRSQKAERREGVRTKGHAPGHNLLLVEDCIYE